MLIIINFEILFYIQNRENPSTHSSQDEGLFNHEPSHTNTRRQRIRSVPVSTQSTQGMHMCYI